MARIAFPLPDTDFDLTEVAVPWKVFTRAGHDVVFATPTGSPPSCDPLLIEGVIFGQLGAEPEAVGFYEELLASPERNEPLSHDTLRAEDFDAAWFAGGHAKGMRPYLESEAVQQFARDFWATGRPVAAICHGPLVLARAGVLEGRSSSCLPKLLELSAWGLTAWKLGDYYRTYPECVQDELRRLGATVDTGPTTGIRRGTDSNDGPAWVLEDGAYLSARWPGDSYLLAKRVLERL